MSRIARIAVAIVLTLSAPAFAIAAPAQKVAAKKAPPKSGSGSEKDQAARISVIADQQGKGLESCEAVAASAAKLVSTDAIAEAMATKMKYSLAQYFHDRTQFETLAEYHARLRQVADLFAGDPDRVVFFLGADPEAVNYDADRRELTVRMKEARPSGEIEASEGRELYPAVIKDQKLGVVSGVTRMGVRFRYERHLRRETFIGIPEAFTTEHQAGSTISIGPDEARRKIESYGFLVFGSLDTPYYEQADAEQTASLDSPYEVLTRTKVWYVKPRCIFLYDGVAKKVVAELVAR